MKPTPARSLRSLHNPQLKEIRRALERGEPAGDGLCAIEGQHLLTEALRSPVEVVRVFTSRPLFDLPAPVEQIDVPDHVLAQIASTETSPGVVSLIRFPRRTSPPTGLPLLVYLDRIQDPGNAGTIARSAEAFGATELLFGPGSVSPYNPKALRAAAGSLFRVPFRTGVQLPLEKSSIGELSIDWYWASPHQGRWAADIRGDRACGLMIGSEAHGVDPSRQALGEPVRIPTAGVESLNAAVAAAILLYEIARQRRPG